MRGIKLRPDGEKYQDCPERIRESIRLYVEERCNPGSFLTAVLENKLQESFSRCGPEEREAMFPIVKYVWNQLPLSVWGSEAKVKNWLTGGEED